MVFEVIRFGLRSRGKGLEMEDHVKWKSLTSVGCMSTNSLLTFSDIL